MKENEIFDKTSRQILAPALNDFVLWILSEACREGIHRVYFLARDGLSYAPLCTSICKQAAASFGMPVFILLPVLFEAAFVSQRHGDCPELYLPRRY